MKKSIVFLYTELADYIKVCFDRLADEDVEVHVFHYSVNPEAPFQFDFDKSACNFYLRTDFSQAQLKAKLDEINPQAIVFSGWIDKGYVEICRLFQGKVKTVIALDSQIERGYKSALSRMRAKLLYKPIFDFAWVPGKPQSDYAQKLGFKESEIFTGFYTTDVNAWNKLEWCKSETDFPHRFVFVGRYLAFKGIAELWEAFKQIDRGDWQLYCAGSGQLFEKRVEHEGIHHVGFVQPSNLYKFVAQGGVFILPSHREPWGVVVHEFAAAGYPIICTDRVGAVSAFLESGKNGFLVKPNDVEQLKKAMQTIVATSDTDLLKMGAHSKMLANRMNVEMWVKTASNFLEIKND